MEKIIVNGGGRLDGKIRVESAKNAVLPMLAGSILTNDDVVIKNCPKIRDVIVMIKILRALGVKVIFDGNDLVVNASGINNFVITPQLCGEMRSSVFLLGALLSRTGRAEMSLPGGCKIGERPIDLHIVALKSLGVDFYDVSSKIVCESKGLYGAEIYLAYPSVGATENLLLAGVTAKGRTVIKNCAREPEIKDFCRFLRSMGANIIGDGTDTIVIEGVKKLSGTEYTPIGDRIEAGTFLIATLMNGGTVEISNCFSQNLLPLIDKFCYNSCKFKANNDIIFIKSKKKIKGFTITTAPHPAFPTDLQAQVCALACVADGCSVVTETVFENRFLHLPEMARMGADIVFDNCRAVFKGVKTLHGETVFAKDLRGGAGLVLAALKAEGTTIVNGAVHINRGYYRFAEKLNALGANVKSSSDGSTEDFYEE